MVIRSKTVSADKPVPPTGGRRERRRQETSEKLFMAAMELFSRKGFAQTKVEDITEAADVGKGTFFNYFPSKEHVLGYLVSKQRGTVERHLTLAREATMPSEEVLISLGRSLVAFPGKSPRWHAASSWRSSETLRYGNISWGRCRWGESRSPRSYGGDRSAANCATKFHRRNWRASFNMRCLEPC